MGDYPQALVVRAGLNALSGIGGFQTVRLELEDSGKDLGLNALSGIGGFQTYLATRLAPEWLALVVLMPCRALEAFRQQ